MKAQRGVGGGLLLVYIYIFWGEYSMIYVTRDVCCRSRELFCRVVLFSFFGLSSNRTRGLKSEEGRKEGKRRLLASTPERASTSKQRESLLEKQATYFVFRARDVKILSTVLLSLLRIRRSVLVWKAEAS